MTDHVYKTVEVTGSSSDGITEAVHVAIRKAAETLHGLDWFELVGVRGHLTDERISHFQATVKVGFRLD